MKLIQIIYVSKLFPGVTAAWYYPMLSRRGLLEAFTGPHGIFIGVWSITMIFEYLIVVFLFQKVHDTTPPIFLLIFSQPLYLMEHLVLRRVCCASASLGVPGVLTRRVLGVTWPTFHQIYRLCVFLLEDPLCLLWLLLGTLAWYVLGVLQCAFLAHYRNYLTRLSYYFLLGEILFSSRAQCTCKHIGPGLLIWTGCVSSPSSLIYLVGILGLIKALS